VLAVGQQLNLKIWQRQNLDWTYRLLLVAVVELSLNGLLTCSVITVSPGPSWYTTSGLDERLERFAAAISAVEAGHLCFNTGFSSSLSSAIATSLFMQYSWHAIK